MYCVHEALVCGIETRTFCGIAGEAGENGNDFIRQFNNNFIYVQLTKMNNLCVIPLFAVGTLCLGFSLEMLP